MEQYWPERSCFIDQGSMRCGENGEGGEGVAVIVVGVRAVTGGGSQSLSLVDQITVHCMTI